VRIALVVSAYDPAVGGVETHVRHLADGLVAGEDDVTVVTHRLGADWPDEERRGRLVVRRFPLTVRAVDYRFSTSLGSFLRSARDAFDVVHVHSYHTLVGVNALLARAGPLVVTPHYHGTGHTRFRAALHHPYRAVGGRVLRSSRAVVCVSRAEARWLAADFPDVRGRIVVIPNGTRAPGDAGGSAVAGPGDVVSIGRLEDYKRGDLLVEAVHRLPAPARLVLVGTGPAGDRLAALARHLGMADRVVLAGRLPEDDVAATLHRAGVVASMSEHEAFGMGLADGLAAGARAVASDIPAHREVVALAGPGAAATLVTPGDVAGLAAALGAALAAGRPDRPSRLPSWEDVVFRTRALYSEVGAP